MRISKQTLVERHNLLALATDTERELINYANIHEKHMVEGPGGVKTGEYTQNDSNTGESLCVDTGSEQGDVTEARLAIYFDVSGRLSLFDATLGRTALQGEHGETTGGTLTLSGSTIAHDYDPITINTSSEEIYIPRGVGEARIKAAAKALTLFAFLADKME